MKRPNPDTQDLFVRGDIREDGYRFYKYTAVLRRDGTFKEIWLHPDVFKDTQEKARKTQAKAYVRRSGRLPNGWARILFEKKKISRCKALWALMREKPRTRIWLEDNCFDPAVFALLLPFTSDYGN